MPGVKSFTIISGLVFFSLAVNARAEIIAPGTYRGYFTTTRWDQAVFHTGPYHLFVADSARKSVDKLRHKPLEIDVTKISQPMNPGAGLIEEIGKVTEKGVASGLKLTATLRSSKVRQGEGIRLTLGFENKSDKSIIVRANQLAVVLVTNSPFSNSDIDYKDPDDRSYWYYSYSYRAAVINAERLRIACREVTPLWTAKEFVERGSGIHLANANGDVTGRIVISPDGKLSSDFVTGQRLLPDDYEVFFYLKSGNLSYAPGPVSKRLPFDVVKSPEK